MTCSGSGWWGGSGPCLSRFEGVVARPATPLHRRSRRSRATTGVTTFRSATTSRAPQVAVVAVVAARYTTAAPILATGGVR